MKNLILLFILGIALSSQAQKTDSIAKSVQSAPAYRLVQEMPKFPGGPDSLNAFIYSHLKYPRSAHENSISGKVVIECIVEANGSLSDIKVKTPVSPKLDEEAVRIVKLMPAFNPGKQRGQAVRVIVTMSVNFVLPKD